MLRVAGTLVRSFALGLGLEERELDPFFDDRSSSLRVIDYPAGAGGARAGAHRDYGCLTIIRSDAAGLEVQARSGDWLPVRAPANGFVVNIGDLMQRWTGDRWVSTLHRVVGARRRSPRRQSLVFFHNPRSDAVIETLGGGRRTTRSRRATTCSHAPPKPGCRRARAGPSAETPSRRNQPPRASP